MAGGDKIKRSSNRHALHVPHTGDPDRKRVLNVLAQRRYREQKKQRIAELEAKVQSLQSEDLFSREPVGDITPFTDENSSEIVPMLGPNQPVSTDQPILEQSTGLPTTSQGQPILSFESAPSPTNLTDLSRPGFPHPPSIPYFFPTPSSPDRSVDLFGDTTGNGPCQIPMERERWIYQESIPNENHDEFLLDMTETLQNPAEPNNNNNNNNNNTSEASPFTELTGWTSPLALANANMFVSRSSLNSQKNDTNLDMPVLKIMKAVTRIAGLLNCSEQMWDPSFQHVVVQSQIPNIMPPHFKPTQAQQQIPHHPLFDLIPWANARTKLICIFSQPEELRPPTARDPLAMMNMVTDMDDEAEGLKICGEDGWDWRNWEVGDKFLHHWWWALDREIVENSNRLRENRGAQRLRITEL